MMGDRPVVCEYAWCSCRLGDCLALCWVCVMPPSYYDLTDTVNPVPHFGKRRGEGAETEAQIVRFAEIRDDVHLFDERLVDLVALWVPNTHVRPTDVGVTG